MTPEDQTTAKWPTCDNYRPSHSQCPELVASVIERDKAQGNNKAVILEIRFANKQGCQFAKAVFEHIYRDDAGTGKYLSGLGFSEKYGIVALTWAMRHAQVTR